MIPKSVRDEIGLVAGEVELVVDGGAVRIQPITGDGLVTSGERLVIPPSGTEIDDELVQTLRESGRR